MKKIKGLSARIGREFNPEKIILFGSYAYGSPTRDSDVDILVVLRFDGKGVYKAIEILNKIKRDFPLDLIVRTPEQIRQRLEWNDFFIKEIIEKGKVLYEADNGRMG